MHKRENLAKLLGRERSKTGWEKRQNLLRQRKQETLGEFNQPHMSMGIGRHMARMMGSRNWQHMRGRG
jgi:hypothetical protein